MRQSKDINYSSLRYSQIKSTDRHAELLHLERPVRHGTLVSSNSFEGAQLLERPRHIFPTTLRFKPTALEINGRKDRRTIYVLGEDRRHYKILDLDNRDDATAEKT